MIEEAFSPQQSEAGNFEISADQKCFGFDLAKKKFYSNAFTVSLSDFFACSCGRPWQLKSGEYQVDHVEVRNKTLQIVFSSDTSTVTVQFCFVNEMLCGTLHVTARCELKDFFVALCLPIPDDARLTMPMSLYNDNPAADPKRLVPHFPSKGSASLVLEESRYPIPGVNAEFSNDFITLFLRPGYNWSLGAERLACGDTRLVLGSGCVAFNGKHDQAYELKNEMVATDKGYRTLKAGEKNYDRLCCKLGASRMFWRRLPGYCFKRL